MSAKRTYETQRIDHLGIVAGICNPLERQQAVSLYFNLATELSRANLAFMFYSQAELYPEDAYESECPFV